MERRRELTALLRAARECDCGYGGDWVNVCARCNFNLYSFIRIHNVTEEEIVHTIRRAGGVVPFTVERRAAP